MKKFFALSLVVFVLFAFAAPVFAQGNVPVDVADPVQLYWLGVIASAVVYVVKLLADKYPQITIRREWLTALLYVLSLGLAITWGGVDMPAFPAWEDPVTFVSALFGFISALLVALAIPTSFATLIYNILLKRVFDGLAEKAGLTDSAGAKVGK
jgi:hypothetical protein